MRFDNFILPLLFILGLVVSFYYGTLWPRDIGNASIQENGIVHPPVGTNYVEIYTKDSSEGGAGGTVYLVPLHPTVFMVNPNDKRRN